jgi:hypothetical protein
MPAWWDTPHELTCDHCEATFIATVSQLKHRRYEQQRTAYCSRICQEAAASARLKQPTPVYGPCPTCGKRFESRVPKIYCSMKCYTSSRAFREMTRLAREKSKLTPRSPRRRGEERTCLECGVSFYVQPAGTKRFCSRQHYRAFMAKRFDRWIANPQSLALPQCYDEFLTSEELPCLVNGCNWRGHWLSLHMNFAHGVQADDFKRAAGFNLNSGIISAPMAESLAQRPQCLSPGHGEHLIGHTDPGRRVRRYQSLEGREHRQKAMALALTMPGPPRVCKGCDKPFTQAHRSGRALFCSIPCRDEWYRRQPTKRDWTATCATCGVTFACTKYQHKRIADGLPVCCSEQCKGILNGSRPKPKARKAQPPTVEANIAISSTTSRSAMTPT